MKCKISAGNMNLIIVDCSAPGLLHSMTIMPLPCSRTPLTGLILSLNWLSSLRIYQVYINCLLLKGPVKPLAGQDDGVWKIKEDYQQVWKGNLNWKVTKVWKDKEVWLWEGKYNNSNKNYQINDEYIHIYDYNQQQQWCFRARQCAMLKPANL